MFSTAIGGKKDSRGIRADIRIQQHNEFGVYSPGLTLRGALVVTSGRVVTFDKLNISFIGTATTHNYVQPEPTRATIQFLKLSMPCDNGALEDGNMFKAGKTYTIPFQFAIPHQLSGTSCRHSSISAALQERHGRLPPTMGDSPANDQSPEAAQISYCIRGVAFTASTIGSYPVLLFSVQERVRVVSSGPEEAPVDCFYNDKLYKFSRTKTFWKGPLTDTGGKLTATAWQPKTVMLSPDGSTATASSIRLKMAFVPVRAELLPAKIHSVSGKLISKTFYDVSPINHAPALETVGRYQSAPFCYESSHKLFHFQVGEVRWENHYQGGDANRQVSIRRSLTGEELQGQGHQSHGRRRGSLPWAWKPLEAPEMQYTTEMDIPFTIPLSKKKIFVPSFDTCYISRSYSVKLTLGVGPTHFGMTLLLPFQIGAQSTAQSTQGALLRRASNEDARLGQFYGESHEELPAYSARL